MLTVKKIMLGALALTCTLPLDAQNDNLMLTAFNKSHQCEKNKDYEGAIDAIKSIPGEPSYEVNLRLGWLNYKTGFNKSSTAYYESATKQIPNSIEAKIAYNYPAYALGNMEAVIAQYKKVLDLDPQNTSVSYNLGSIYYYNNDFKNALGYFEKILSEYPFDYDALLMAAWTNQKLNKNTEAEILFNKVLLYSPTDKSALEGLSYVKGDLAKDEKLRKSFAASYELAGKSDYKGAINILKEVYDKTSYEQNLRLGWLNYAAGLNKEAITYYKTAIELKPKAVEPRLGIAYPLAALGNSNEVVEQYNTILSIDPQNTYANYRLGYLYYEKKDYNTAITYFQKIVSYYPFGYDGLLMLAWTNLQMGKNAEAKALFNKVLLLSPSDKSAVEGLKLVK